MRTYKHKKFYPGVQHIYQRSDDWGVIFYDDFDRLVFYTYQCIAKRKHHIVILAASLMFNHVHSTIKAWTEKQTFDFAWASTSPFARAYNYRKKRDGKVFHRQFGWSSKKSRKQAITNICYVENNHVEKQLCTRASESRWDFLAYAQSDHPFSEEIISPSKRLSVAMKTVRRRSDENLPLSYRHLNIIFNGLDEVETQQLIDYIIVTYKLVDFDETVKYFSGIQDMITAPEYNTGSDYGKTEEYSTESEVPYIEMLKILKGKKVINSVYTMDSNNLVRLANELSARTTASAKQIKRLLHIK